MRSRFLAVLLIALCGLPIASGGDEAADPAKEALRQRLLAAYRAQARIHHAMQWKVPVPDKATGTNDFTTEVFQEGSLGLLLLTKEEGSEGDLPDMCMATNGIVTRGSAGHVTHLCMEGADTINAFVEPYGRARTRLSKCWGCKLRALEPYAPIVDFYPRKNEVTINLAIQTGTVPGWLGAKYMADKRLVLEEAKGVVRIEGDRLEGTIDLTDGLPATWRLQSQTTGRWLEAKRADPRLDEAAVRRHIDEACADVSLDNLLYSLRSEPWLGLLGLVTDVLAAADASLREEARQQEAAREMAKADAEARPVPIPLGCTWEDVVKGHVVARTLALQGAVEHFAQSDELGAADVAALVEAFRLELEKAHRAAHASSPKD